MTIQVRSLRLCESRECRYCPSAGLPKSRPGEAYNAVMLSSRGQAVLEAKILSSASNICPWPRPRVFVLELFILASWKRV